MRPQGFGQAGAGLDDLGWNDMGFEPPKPAHLPPADAEHDAFGEVIPAHPANLAGLTPVESPVHGQQAEIAGRLSAYEPDDSGEEEIDETAELYDPEAEEFELQADELAPQEAEEILHELEAAAPATAREPLAEADAAPAPVALADIASAPVPSRRARKQRAKAGSKAKAAFTLRLDPERHLKLRLASAVSGRSAQVLLTDALDELLQSIPELDAMADKAKRKG